MDFSLRPALPETDFDRLAELVTLAGPNPTTGDDLRAEEGRNFPGKLRQRLLAVRPDGTIVGGAMAIHFASQPEGQFYLTLAVEPDHRCQGIGTALYNEILAFMQAHGAREIVAEISEGHTQGVEFAQHRGFHLTRHAIYATLDLATFDPSPYYGLVAAVEAQGIRLFSFADVERTPENLRQLYEVNRMAAIDDPAALDDSFPPFDHWCEIVPGATWFQPQGQIIAADGDRFIGFGAVTYDDEANTAQSDLAGVDPAYRGRKIAQALKLRTIEFAIACGATQISTENDSRNTVMRAINTKFGYRPQGGYYALVKTI